MNMWHSLRTLFKPCLFFSIGLRSFRSLVICHWADDRLVGECGLGATFAHTVFCRSLHMWNFQYTCDKKANHIWMCVIQVCKTLFSHVEFTCEEANFMWFHELWSVFHLCKKKRGKHMAECSSHVIIVLNLWKTSSPHLTLSCTM